MHINAQLLQVELSNYITVEKFSKALFLFIKIQIDLIKYKTFSENLNYIQAVPKIQKIKYFSFSPSLKKEFIFPFSKFFIFQYFLLCN